jgi:hypothetical protein
VDQAPALPQPKPARLRGVLWTFVGALFLSFVLATPQWIPEWDTFMQGAVVCLLVTSAVAGAASFVAARRHCAKLPPVWRWLVYFGCTATMLAVWGFAALAVASELGNGVFASTYKRQLHFAEAGITIYLYDSSFLHPETIVYQRRGWLPVRRELMQLRRRPEQVEVELRGQRLVIGDRTVDLRDATDVLGPAERR